MISSAHAEGVVVALEHPLRMEDLDGPTIREYRNRPFRPPLLFPSRFDPFARIDAGDPSFISLIKLSGNPELARNLPEKLPEVFGIVGLEDSEVSKSVPVASHDAELTERVRKIEQKLLGIDATKASLPADDQLAAFLNKDEANLLQQVEELQLLLEKVSSSPVDVEDPGLDVQPRKLSDVLVPASRQESALPALNGSAFGSTPILAATPAEQTLSNLGFQSKGSDISPVGSILKLKASVSMPNGGVRPAQASEVYVTTKNISELLSELKLEDAVAGEVSTLVDLWGRAEKDQAAYPEVVLGVKSILLKAKVRRTRTDPYGKAAVAGLSPDENYFLIGIDKDVETQVVTIWSKEVKFTPGENEVELTAGDVIFRK
ncbi:MAG: hypothetical protein VB997_00365 [Opitutales bacterium]